MSPDTLLKILSLLIPVNPENCATEHYEDNLKGRSGRDGEFH